MYPNWLRILLLVLTLGSFLPQLHLIITRKDASGISLHYLLFNLVAGSEQFILDLIYILLQPKDGAFVHHPLMAGDWINLAQTALYVLLFSVYFALCLWFPSEASLAYKRAIFSIYAAYFLAAFAPLILLFYTQQDTNDKSGGRDFLGALITYPHLFIMNYIGTLLIIVAIYYQGRLITSSDPSHGSLSTLTLAIQAVLFIALGISWIFRISSFNLPDNASWWDYRVLRVWYELVGSVAVDNAVFGIGQGILFALAVRCVRNVGNVLGTEREALLGGI